MLNFKDLHQIIDETHVVRFNDTAYLVTNFSGREEKVPGYQGLASSTDFEIYEEAFWLLKTIELNNYKTNKQ